LGPKCAREIFKRGLPKEKEERGNRGIKGLTGVTLKRAPKRGSKKLNGITLVRKEPTPNIRSKIWGDPPRRGYQTPEYWNRETI